MGLVLSGCGENSFLDRDPLAFLSSPPKAKNEKKMAEAVEPPDIFTNIEPLEVKGGGTLGSFGVNLDTYFAGELKDEDDRIMRLEKAVVAMHKDLKTLAPAVQRLADIEVAMKRRVETSALQAPQPLLHDDTGTPMQPAMRVIATGMPQQTSPPPGTPVHQGARLMADASSSTIVSGIRTGEHTDKVRIVFDVTKKNTSYSADLDNNENILVVEMPNARWKTPTDFESFRQIPVLKSYKVDSFNNGQGNIFVLQLKGPTQILAQGKYPALSGEGERIVIDLKK